MRSSLMLLTVTFLVAGCQPKADLSGPQPIRDTSEKKAGSSPDFASNSTLTNATETPAEQSKIESTTESENLPAPTNSASEVEVITFDDLNIGMPVDVKFRKIMLEYNDGRAGSLFGKWINVAGYMNATDTMKGVKEFILLRNLECKFGPGGQADHLIHVLMQDDLETEFTDQVVYVEGVLELKEFPEEGPSTWSIYDLKATKASTKPPLRRR